VTTDLVSRLRNYMDHVDDIGLMAEAADEIERLRRVLADYAVSEIYGAQAREALRERR
jgi:hypothetical protein